jgi:hypothetical protein
MASNRISIYPSPAIDRLLEALPGASVSGRISQAADYFMTIMDCEIQAIQWAKNEWCAVMDVLNGAQIGAVIIDSPDWAFSWANMADSPEMDAKWGVDHEQLAAQMRAMSPTRKLAVYEAAARFWARAELPADEALAAAGIRPVS